MPLEKIKKEAREVGGFQLFDAELHSPLAKFHKHTDFEDKRDWLCGYFAAVIVSNYFKTKEKK